MEGLIQKSGYIKSGSGGGHYAEYIATREGAEELKPGGYLEHHRYQKGVADYGAGKGNHLVFAQGIDPNGSHEGSQGA